jgi:hypothetical protein
VEALVRRRRVLAGANAGALLVCAALLSAPAAGAATKVGRGFDPAAQGTVLARARMESSGLTVLVQPQGQNAVDYPGAASPAVDGDRLAYADGEGIKIVEWRTRQPVAQIDGSVTKPALDWPLLVFVRTSGDYKRLVLADLRNPAAPTLTRIASVKLRNDLGRPSLDGGRLAWHVVTRGHSKVVVASLATGRRRVVRRSEVAVEENPSLTPWRIAWVEQRAGSASVLVRRFGRHGTKKVYQVHRRDRRLLTTAITGRTVYVTRWAPRSGDSTLVRVNF